MAAASKATILGCGSNVVDVFFRVRAMPVAGTKGYFQDPTKVVEGTVVGGVTLNHLSWAAALGAPTGLLALVSYISYFLTQYKPTIFYQITNF